MQIEVILFGPMADAAGQDRIRLSIPGLQVPISDLRAEIILAYPELAKKVDACRFAVNHAFADGDCQIVEGDEVALIGFVTGG